MIRNGKLRIFAPFVNDNYRNTWSHALKLEEDDLESYYTRKRQFYREEQVEPDLSKWWANGNIICNELTKKEDKNKSQVWGDHFLAPLRDMLGEACKSIFFIKLEEVDTRHDFCWLIPMLFLVKTLFYRP